jgi:diguanylate cyclase (GGDEF)-like protein/PAS domain S-box-containing protein
MNTSSAGSPQESPASVPASSAERPHQHVARRLLRTLQAIADAVISTDARGRVEFINLAAQQLTGFTLAEALGKPLDLILQIAPIDGDDAPSTLPGDCLNRIVAFSGDTAVTLTRHDGSHCDIEFSCASLDDGQGGIDGVVVNFRDVTERHAADASLSWAAHHDALTGLINRSELENRLRRLLEHACTTGNSHALCYIDLDHFKRINDGLGHVAGDEYLKGLTASLRERIRGADTIARLGGDEFAVLLYSCPIEKAQTIADGIGECIAAYQLDWKGQSIGSTASIGVVEINRQTPDLTELLASADVACYAAKNEGGNRVHTFHITESMVTDKLGEIHWLRCMQHAIVNNRFLLYSQPIIPAADTRLPHGGELLLRLQDDNGNIFTPAHFMPAATRYHVLPDIDRWLVRKVIGALSRKGEAMRSTDWTAMNVSGQSLLDNRFLDTLLGLIKEHGLSAERLCVEISEQAFVEHTDRVTHFTRMVRDVGCQVAIDDCGAVVGSFSLLRKVAVDYIKISEVIIRRMAANPVDREIAVALARIAQRLGVRTVAECVADVATLLEARRIGIDYVQGNVIAEPRMLRVQGTGAGVEHLASGHQRA